ncbi:MAG: S-adenosylmethionine:tRNA ribosyltransferase-isomerase [Bacteroidales bacterium]|nr:S-adenosylmethionine:tRNA ribosyltransferase-isomerase [Bacteroidales bacterium]MBN2749164.1 S-adenosylmethionine:tRNA ribosyltransferase-isomerase [Bacteroidales bacterium]
MKTSVKNISISDFDYPLPDERIAKHPLAQRDASKLLIYKDSTIREAVFSSITELISPGDLLVFNNTKVVQARLFFAKSTGATIEIFILDPEKPKDYQVAFTSTSEVTWKCIVGNIKRWKSEDLQAYNAQCNLTLTAHLVERTPDGAYVKFSWDNQSYTFAQIIELFGEVPIPPYLNREPERDDRLRYQTVYARPEGSVAAPTAGLHFTSNVITRLQAKGVTIGELTLHVGAGTFKPVKTETIADHDMHTEHIYVSKKLLEQLIAAQGKCVAVGTTSVRTLESLYWLAAKLLSNAEGVFEPFVEQWDPYTLNVSIEPQEALLALLSYLEANGLEFLSASTRIIIVPGYQFKFVGKIVTNFHQPKSTLLLLVSAFIGDDWKTIYDYALWNGFRFLSYGDSSFLEKCNALK